jgi:hypothetical protein
MSQGGVYADHTMGDALEGYLDIKMHDLIRTFTGKQIVVRGKYERSARVSSIEKDGKQFNWHRPTAEISADNTIFYLNCFPGCDYVHHYAAIVSTYLQIHSIFDVTVEAILPSLEDTLRALLKTNIMALPKCDVVVLGVVEKLHAMTSFNPWQGEGDFCWSMAQIGDRKVALLGCKFSFWGDIAGHLVAILQRKGVHEIMYVGKVGGLSADMQPNLTLATGCESLLHGEKVQWDSIIKVPAKKEGVAITCGAHVTLPSILSETKSWLKELDSSAKFVDPEIGWMAKTAQQLKMGFGYLHLVSDNLARPSSENLSNERSALIQCKRKGLFLHIADLLKLNILMRCSTGPRLMPYHTSNIWMNSSALSGSLEDHYNPDEDRPWSRE